MGSLAANQSFFMSDQITQFKVIVNIFTSEGRYGYHESVVQSKKLVYASLQLPKTFI